MISRTQSTASWSALDAAEALGWGWAISASPSRSAHGAWLRIGLLGFLCSSSVLAVLGFIGFLNFVASIERFERRPETRTDGIVALTGGAQRISDAIDLLAQGYARRLLISGVNERTSRAEIARLNPGQLHLFECCVDLDYRARNTIGNAIETRRWTDQNRFRSLIVVTSNYHMPRTLVELDHVLPGTRKVPYSVVNPVLDINSWWRDPSTARVLVSEYLKFLAVWARTRFETDPE
jgi:uncharacterized SAM-binding protein YcdF (DUF218 family)